MRTITFGVLMSMVACCVLEPFSSAAPFTLGNLAVLRVVSTSGLLTNVSAFVFVDEYATNGTFIQSLPIPTNGPNQLVLTANATAEGALTRSPNGRWICFAGYSAGVGVTNIPFSFTTNIPRCIATMDGAGQFTVVSTNPAYYNTNNIRGVASDGVSNFWSVGNISATGIGGLVYYGFDAPGIRILSGGFRTVNIFNGQLYYTAAANGVSAYSSLPTNPATGTVVISTAATPSCYALSINPSGNLAYVSDDSQNASGGVLRYTNNGTTWTFSYRLGTGVSGTGARGLAVDWAGPNPVIYASTSDNTFFGNPSNRLIRIVDTGNGSPATTLASANTNSSFRGVAFAPYGWPPLITDFAITNLGARLSWISAPGSRYQPQFTTNLSDTNWLALGSPFVASNATTTVLDTNPGIATKFYRVRVLP